MELAQVRLPSRRDDGSTASASGFKPGAKARPSRERWPLARKTDAAAYDGFLGGVLVAGFGAIGFGVTAPVLGLGATVPGGGAGTPDTAL